MTRRRFIADRWDRSAGTASLTGDQAAHLARVLRATPGQRFDLVARGFLHRAEIAAVDLTPAHEQVHFALHEELEADAALPLHLLLAIFKFDHLEWAIEKATELGVARISPVLARRTEKHLAQAAAKRSERWRRIALEAAKQSRRSTLPDLADPAPLKAALAAETAPTRILLSELEQATPLAAALATPAAAPATGTPPASTSDPGSAPPGASVPLSPASPGPTSAPPARADSSGPASPAIALAIGPEGGWTPEEIALFHAHGWQPVTLGPRILRAETAAIAAVAIAGSVLG